MFRSKWLHGCELRPKSVTALLNNHICVGWNLKRFVIECDVMFVLVQTTVGISCISSNAVLLGVCS